MGRIGWKAAVFDLSAFFRSWAFDSAGSFRHREGYRVLEGPDEDGGQVRGAVPWGQETGQVAGARGLVRTFSAWDF